jgi:hypothetical protein
MYVQDLSSAISKAPKFKKIQLINKKNKFIVVQQVQVRVVKRTAMDNDCGSF